MENLTLIFNSVKLVNDLAFFAIIGVASFALALSLCTERNPLLRTCKYVMALIATVCFSILVVIVGYPEQLILDSVILRAGILITEISIAFVSVWTIAQEIYHAVSNLQLDNFYDDNF